MKDIKGEGLNGSSVRLSRREALRGLAGIAAASLATSTVSPRKARAAGPVTLQYMTANLTEAQYAPVWKE
ncbi:MAG TPA: hypothetical protein VN203_07500, partial [Candidatus Acidoferrum sp.]|nr:hypothetical protein [Candidatus Acidoferrum sp.]